MCAAFWPLPPSAPRLSQGLVPFPALATPPCSTPTRFRRTSTWRRRCTSEVRANGSRCGAGRPGRDAPPRGPRAEDVGADEERNRTRRAIRSLFTVRACCLAGRFPPSWPGDHRGQGVWWRCTVVLALTRVRCGNGNGAPLRRPSAPALHHAAAAPHGQRGYPDAWRRGARPLGGRQSGAAGACRSLGSVHQSDSELNEGFVDGIQQLRDTLMAEVRSG